MRAVSSFKATRVPPAADDDEDVDEEPTTGSIPPPVTAKSLSARFLGGSCNDEP